jgi:hypothetical protein
MDGCCSGFYFQPSGFVRSGVDEIVVACRRVESGTGDCMGDSGLVLSCCFSFVSVLLSLDILYVLGGEVLTG